MKLTGKIKRRHVFNALLSFLMFLLTLVIIFPLITMVLTSLKPESELTASSFRLLPEIWQFSNYIRLFKAADWGRCFFNTVVVTVFTVFFSLLVNSIAGFAFARLRFPGRNMLFLITLIGMMIPTQVTMIPLFVIMKNFPLIGGNNLLGSGGSGLLDTYAGIFLPNVAGAYGVFLFRQFFLNFPGSLDDAAKIDGLTTWKRYTRIYIPLGAPIFATLTVLKTTQAWNDYTWPLIITRSESMKTIQLALDVFKTETSTNWVLMMAAATMIVLPLILLFLFAQKYFVEGITSSGMK